MSVTLTGKRPYGTAGYFRIGDVVLTIPPDAIKVVRMSNNEELTALRAAFPFYKKTGHERLDVTISWKAIVDTSLGTPDYSQLEDLRRIVAFFKAAPFVQVENGHLRQVIMAEDPSREDYEHMAFALRQLRLETLPDIVDGVEATLNMTYFNYAPYSASFGYKGPREGGCPAHESPDFQLYIDNWIGTNLDRSDLPDWQALDAENLRLSWRQYLAIPLGPQGDVWSDTSSPAQPPQHHPTSSSTPLPTYLTQLANQLGLDWNIIQYQIKQESGGKQNAVSTKGAVGLMQLTPIAVEELNRWARVGAWGADPSLKNVTFEQVRTDPQINAKMGMYYMRGLLRMFDGDYSKALAAYNAGPNRVRARGYQGADGSWLNGMPAETRQYVRNIMGMSGKPISSDVLAMIQPQEGEQPLPEVNYEDLAKNWQIGDYVLDHATERAVFYYKEQTLNCTDEEMYPLQFSVVLINNLAPIPIAASPFPTYQHIGSPGTMVNVSIIGKGEQSDASSEPVHEGLKRLSGAISDLDEQYHAMRNEWRAASSVHTMQALFVQNRFLAMLGISALLPSELHTETVPDSPEVTQAQLLAAQYENTYEQLESFRVKGLIGPYQEAWEQILSSNVIGENMDDSKRALLKEVIAFKVARDKKDRGTIVQFLQAHPEANPGIPFNFEVDEDLRAHMRGLLDIVVQEGEKAPAQATRSKYGATPRSAAVSLGDRYPAIQQRIASGQFMWDDYLVLTQDESIRGRQTVKDFVAATEKRISAGGQTQGRFSNPIDQAYSELFRWNYLNKSAFNNALTTLETQDPKIKAVFQDLQTASGPGKDPKNTNHGTYRDLGLRLTLAGADNNPGYYFVNDTAKMRNTLADQVSVMGNRAVQVTENYKDFVKPAQGTTNVKTQPPDPALIKDFAQESMLRAQLPPIHMGRAFPGYKIFFMEDDNSGVYYCYDDFYSYNAVLGIEIIRYQDQPDTARIQLANSSNILTHRLFDNSVWGKVEQRDNKYAHVVPGNSRGEATVRGEGGPIYTVTEETTGHVNLTKGFKGAENKAVPSQYFALQPGTKIQIRFGYTNDPDKLFPVFTGMITEMEEGEVMTIIAQSYLVELMTNLNSGEGAIESDYGGLRWWREAGDTESIISKMLEVSRANHFGKWQVRQKTGTLAKGFQYDQLKGLWADASGAVRNMGEIGRKASFWLSTLNNGYNRAPENIRINRFFTPGGALNDNVTRPWTFEDRTPLPGDRPAYHIPEDFQNISPWQVMRDVARRYPENILCVKQFGFPYQADATLVFADPNDWYISRFALHNEGEMGRFTPTDDQTFSKWWNSVGKSQTIKVLTEVCNAVYTLSDTHRDEYIARIQRDKLSGLQSTVNELATRINVLAGNDLGGDNMSLTEKLNALTRHFVLNWALFGNEYRKVRLRRAVQLLNQLWGDYELAMKIARGGPDAKFQLGDRFQPVRRWHMITSEFIAHNGIVLNENIANAVKIQKKVIPASGHIPKELLRVMDATQLIIDAKHNCDQTYLEQLYAQSFLREEVGKMYRGELMLSGMPEIEPYDVILLADTHRGMYGPIEVESVVHEFSQEYGYITIVRPRALVLVNEALGAGVCSALTDFLWGEWGWGRAGLIQEAGGLISRLGNSDTETRVAAGVMGAGTAAAAMAQRGMVRAAGRMIATKTGQALTARAATMAAGSATAAGATAVGGGLTAIGSAPAWLVAGAILTAGATYKSFVWAVERQEANPLFLVPLTQFDRPWVAGVQGWELSDLSGIFMDNFKRMVDVEIMSTIEGFKKIYNLNESY